MKSAYELAMEKLEKTAPTKKLSEKQLVEIREIDSLYQSRIAERKVFLEGKIQQAIFSNDLKLRDELQKQLANDIAILKEEMETKKEKLR